MKTVQSLFKNIKSYSKYQSILVIIILSLAQLMISLDFSIVNVALPSIQAQFHLTPTSLQWVVSAYALTFGSFLLLGGRLSDIFNRKRIFLIGLIVFSIASLMGGLAPSPIIVFISRAIQGLGAAMLAPTALSLITTTFPEGNQRNFALSIFTAMAAIGFTTGVTLGGILTQFLTWHWAFFINVPLGIFTSIIGLLIIPNTIKNHLRGSFDVTGAVLIATALLILIYAITQISTPDESIYEIIILFGISLVLVVSFLFVEHRACQPLVPFDIFQHKNIILSNVIMLLAFGAIAGFVFLVTLLLQEGIGYSALQTGLIFIPAGIGAITGSILTPRILKRIDFSKIMVLGLIIFCLCIIGIAKFGTFDSIVIFMIMSYFAFLGISSVMISLNIAGTTGVEVRQQGLAAGLITTSQWIGGAIGVSMVSVVAALLFLSVGNNSLTRIEIYMYSMIISIILVIIATLLALYLTLRRLSKKN